MTLVRRGVKGSALTAAEFDGNTNDLDGRLHALETNPPVAIGISNFTVTGSQFTVHLTDGSSFGPFTLPVLPPVWRGAWGPATAYQVYDIITVSGQGLFYVLRAHTSGSVFDPAAANSSGFYYQLAYADPGTAITQSVSGVSVDLTRAHVGKFTRCTSGGDGAGLVALNLTSVVFAVNDEMHFRQSGSGTLSVVAGTGVTVNGVTGFLTKTLAQGAVMTIKCVAVDTFDVFGMLAAV